MIIISILIISVKVRFGVVKDLGNGNYSVQICPVIAGTYNLEVRYMGAVGASGGALKYFGLNVGSAPFSVIVKNGNPLGLTCTVTELQKKVNVSVPTHFIVTARDSYYNLILDRKVNITLTVNGISASNLTVFDFKNGSYYVQYTPTQSGENNLVVKLNNMNVINSPLKNVAADVISVPNYAYIVGQNLYHGKKKLTL